MSVPVVYGLSFVLLSFLLLSSSSTLSSSFLLFPKYFICKVSNVSFLCSSEGLFQVSARFHLQNCGSYANHTTMTTHNLPDKMVLHTESFLDVVERK